MFSEILFGITEDKEEELKKKNIVLLQEPKLSNIDYNKLLDISYLENVYKKYGINGLNKEINKWNNIRTRQGLQRYNYEKEINYIINKRSI